MSDTQTDVTWRKQLCQGGTDMTGHLFSDYDADEVRFWEGAHGDFCLIAVTKQADGTWRVTGGDGHWMALADMVFGSPDDAMEAYGDSDPRYTYREAVCRCGDGAGEECDD